MMNYEKLEQNQEKYQKRRKNHEDFILNFLDSVDEKVVEIADVNYVEMFQKQKHL